MLIFCHIYKSIIINIFLILLMKNMYLFFWVSNEKEIRSKERKTRINFFSLFFARISYHKN
jgi:hypothetical protein